jgi:hypothetical protein
MKKKLYYTVEKKEDDGFLAGVKDIAVYSIIDNTPKPFTMIEDCLNEVSSIDKIKEYLNDNGFGDDEFELILL